MCTRYVLFAEAAVCAKVIRFVHTVPHTLRHKARRMRQASHAAQVDRKRALIFM